MLLIKCFARCSAEKIFELFYEMRLVVVAQVKE